MQFQAIWSYLKIFGAIWSYLELFGAVWTYLDLFVPIWTHLDLFGNFPTFHRISLLGQFGLVVAMSVWVRVCLSPSHAFF